jgi:hypothetical protein
VNAFIDLIGAAKSYLDFIAAAIPQTPPKEEVTRRRGVLDAIYAAKKEIAKFGGSKSADELDVSQIIKQFGNGLTADQGERIAKSLEILASCVREDRGSGNYLETNWENEG